MFIKKMIHYFFRLLQKTRGDKKELELEKTRFRVLIENGDIPNLIVKSDGRILLANSSAAKLLQFDIDELQQMTVEQLIPKDRRTMHIHFRENYIKKPKIRRMSEASDLVVLSKSGTEIPVDISLTPLEIAKETCVLCNIKDLSSEKHYQKRLERQNKHIKLIYDISYITYNAKDLSNAMALTLHTISEAIDWPIGHIYQLKKINNISLLHSTNKWYLKYPDRTHLFKTVSETTTFEKGIGLPGRVWASGESAWITNIQEDVNFPRAKAIIETDIHSAVAFPVFVDNALAYVFEFFTFEVKKTDHELMRLFEVLSEQLSQMFERRITTDRIQFLAYHDYLTRVCNRACFEQAAENVLLRAQRYHHSIAIIIIDLDNFKHINDHYSHETGDVVLKTVADRFKNAIRGIDTLARFGGDEFAIITDHVNSIDNVITIAEKLQRAARAPIVFDQHTLIVNFSMGIAIFPENGETLSELLRNADHALYQAKTNGKNQYVIYNANSL